MDVLIDRFLPDYLADGVCEADTPSTNTNRIYSVDLLKKIVDDFVPVMGHLGHPKDKDGNNSSVIQFSEVSHEVINLWFDSSTNWLMAVLRVLETMPKGILLKESLERGTKYKFAMSGQGASRLTSTGYYTIKPDSYKLITINLIEEIDGN